MNDKRRRKIPSAAMGAADRRKKVWIILTAPERKVGRGKSKRSGKKVKSSQVKTSQTKSSPEK